MTSPYVQSSTASSTSSSPVDPLYYARFPKNKQLSISERERTLKTLLDRLSPPIDSIDYARCQKNQHLAIKTIQVIPLRMIKRVP